MIMRCREVQRKLELFVAQELAPAERERVEAHLASCARCREALERARSLEKVLVAPPVPPLPEGFAERVVGRARNERAAVARPAPRPELARPAWQRIGLSVGTAAAVAAGLLLGLLMGSQTWQSGAQRASVAAAEPTDPLAASGFDELAEPGGDSLAQAYLQLTAADDSTAAGD